MKKILVTVDGSENSNRALLEAKMIAKCTGADVDVLTVTEYLVISPYMGVKYKAMPLSDHAKEDAQNILKDALTLFDDFEGKVEGLIESGDPADVIIETAKQGKYNLLVMGSRGLGTFSRAMLGSVSNKVLNHGSINVLIIK
nr:universal stress protein [Tissierella sp.]